MSGTSYEGTLETLIAENARPPQEWSAPVGYDLGDQEARHEVEHHLQTGMIRSVVDPIEAIANDLYEYAHPDGKDDHEGRSAFVKEVMSEGLSYGKWFHFPWSGELVRYPEMPEHRALRTSRNRDLITEDEQACLYDSTVAVFGLSVGSKVVESLVSSGIGGKVIIGDPDTVSPSNLNRLQARFSDVGTSKVDLAARKISEIDPYIKQVHFRDGVTRQNLGELALHGPGVVFDEVDNLSIKAALRTFGAENKVPVVMATDLGDRSLIDVERFDGNGAKPFNGRLKSEEIEALINGTVTPEQMQKMTMKIVGLRHITSRMLESVMQIDKTIPGMPQLATTATVGGAYAAITAREILLGHEVNSGRYVVSPKSVLKLRPQKTAIEGLRTVVRFARSKSTT